MNKPQDTKPWGNLEIDITPLRWTSRRDEVAGAQQLTLIPPGGIDVAYARWDRQGHSPAIPNARHQDRNAMSGFGPGHFLFHVVITAEGIKAIDTYIKVSTIPDGMNVEKSKALDLTEISSVGIYMSLDPETPPTPRSTAHSAHPWSRL